MPFDIGALLSDVFKDVQNTHKLLTGYGYDVTEPMVYQWFYRRALPSKWILVLLAIHETETGKPAALAKYLR